MWLSPAYLFHRKVAWKGPQEVILSSIPLEARLLPTLDQNSHCFFLLDLETHKDGNYASSWDSLIDLEEN